MVVHTWIYVGPVRLLHWLILVKSAMEAGRAGYWREDVVEEGRCGKGE